MIMTTLLFIDKTFFQFLKNITIYNSNIGKVDFVIHLNNICISASIPHPPQKKRKKTKITFFSKTGSVRCGSVEMRFTSATHTFLNVDDLRNKDELG